MARDGDAGRVGSGRPRQARTHAQVNNHVNGHCLMGSLGGVRQGAPLRRRKRLPRTFGC